MPRKDPYREFLRNKAPIDPPTGFDVPESALSPPLFDFQRAICRWALRRGRAAVWADCGMGKTISRFQNHPPQRQRARGPIRLGQEGAVRPDFQFAQ